MLKFSIRKILNRKNLFLLVFCVISLFLTSCTSTIDWFLGRVNDKEINKVNNSSTAQTTRTAYDTSLHEFGKMLDAYNVPAIRLQSKAIGNYTGDSSLPKDLTTMLITAVNKIGTKVQYVPYDPSYVMNESATGGQIKRTLPQLVMSGGITEYNKELITKSRKGRLTGRVREGQFGSNYSYDGQTGFSAGSSASRLTLDLHMMHYTTQTFLSDTQVSNTITVRKTNLGWGIGFYFERCGLTFDYTLNTQQGIYYALRLLVDLSAMESIGKYYDVPYWRCIKGATPDYNMITSLRDEFFDLQTNDQITYLKEYLFLNGFKISDMEREAPITENDKKIIDEAMKHYKCDTYTDLFIKLWESVPIDQARERNKEYIRFLRQQQLEKQKQAEEKAQQQAKEEVAKKAAANNDVPPANNTLKPNPPLEKVTLPAGREIAFNSTGNTDHGQPTKQNNLNKKKKERLFGIGDSTW